MAQPDFAARNKLDVLVRERKDALSMRWLAATAAIAGHSLLLAAIAREIPDEVPWAVTALCWLLAALLAVLAVVLPRRRLTDKELARHLESPVDLELCSRRLRLDPEQRRVLAELPSVEQRAFGLILLFGRPHTLGLGLSAALAFVGLGYGLATRGLIEAAPFLLAALALNCWHFPRLAPLVERGLELASADDDADEDAIADLTLAELELLARGDSQQPPAREPQRPPAPKPLPRRAPRLRRR